MVRPPLRSALDLPVFKYHPDPIATGSVVASEDECDCCGLARGYIYVGPVYSADEPDALCPWCISSGLAHEQFAVEFTDTAAVGAYDPALRKTLTRDVKEEVAFRTPGFSSWQQEKWLVHCGDACAFLGPAGPSELEAYESAELLESIRADLDFSEAEFSEFIGSLDRADGPTAYVFECRHCGQRLGYADFT